MLFIASITTLAQKVAILVKVKIFPKSALFNAFDIIREKKIVGLLLYQGQLDIIYIYKIKDKEVRSSGIK